MEGGGGGGVVCAGGGHGLRGAMARAADGRGMAMHSDAQGVGRLVQARPGALGGPRRGDLQAATAAALAEMARRRRMGRGVRGRGVWAGGALSKGFPCSLLRSWGIGGLHENTSFHYLTII